MSDHYFAYGSNLHPGRLGERVATARLVGSGRLDGFGLRFHKRGLDGSAKCNVVPAPAAVAYGALYRIEAGDWPALDAAEEGYDRCLVAVAVAGGTLAAQTYRARPERIDPALLPYAWYRDLVLAGARRLALPADYLAALDAVAVRDDLDPARARRMEALVARLRAS